MGNDPSSYTRHHILAKSQGGVDSERNITYLRRKVHEAFHIVFGNMLPHEQFGRLLEINEKVLTRQYKENALEVLNAPSGYIYQKGLLVKK